MSKKVVLAFSGGLDTSFCAAWLREQGYAVHAVAVQTGGFDADELAAIQNRARQLDVAEFKVIDAVQPLYERALRYLLYANALRGAVYPLCVSCERVAQAQACAQHALHIGADALAHGSTGAGNDQVRFDVAFRVLAPRLELITPIRSLGLSRAEASDFLAQRGVVIPARTTAYSVNRGLWGVTIGGGESHDSESPLPESAYVLTPPRDQWPRTPEIITIDFERGEPCALDGVAIEPVKLIATLNERAARHGVGRGMHVGDTILGIKGRVAFEAPAAVTLIAAHRELEKLTLTRQQLSWKQTLGEHYGALLHEGHAFEPLMRDIEAFLESSQRPVSGRARVEWYCGGVNVLGASSPRSMMNPCVATYGEGARAWNAAEAAAFCKLYGIQEWLAAQAGA